MAKKEQNGKESNCGHADPAGASHSMVRFPKRFMGMPVYPSALNVKQVRKAPTAADTFSWDSDSRP